MSKLSHVRPNIFVGPIFTLSRGWLDHELECDERSKEFGATRDPECTEESEVSSARDAYLSQLHPRGRTRN
jgi:hypothetical protein